MLKRCSCLALLFWLCACAHSVHLVHVSDFSPFAPHTKGKIIKVKTEQFIILGFVTQTDYVDEAYRQLQNKCKNGRINGITTQFSTSLGFFSWTNKILMQGLCIKS